MFRYIFNKFLDYTFTKFVGVIMTISIPAITLWFAHNSKYFKDPLIIWMLILFSVLIALSIIYIIISIHYKYNNKLIKLEEIIRKKFINQTIRLDGKKFVNCQFDACTIEYNGGDFILDNSDIGEDCRLYFMTRESFATANLIYNFAFLENSNNQLFMLDKYGRIQKQPAIIEK